MWFCEGVIVRAQVCVYVRLGGGGRLVAVQNPRLFALSEISLRYKFTAR